ncbi:ATP-binding protein [Nonlabens agnitus]|uniref:Bipolar DNA helicase n=1 Tax=Nonlabens agnitus TaxID=870484 RepID=A0A2S9WRZ6_9FLAO|nr:ATP-binding protein [Nonlabens agnitus]PRP66267.1 Bipolar DNA helicase [Nonlabens agnitus]
MSTYEEENKLNAEVISVYPDKVRISVEDLESFKIAGEALKVGSYVRISDNENSVLIAIIENFSIEVADTGSRKYIIEANPLGVISNDVFTRGGDSIAIPPKKVEPAREDEIKKIYEQSITAEDNFTFSMLSSNHNIKVPVNGNKFFNKHIAIVGSTGSGKSHTLTTILQKAVATKSGDFALNNTHVVIFDIHSEYKSAFPDSNLIDISNLTLPYWMLNSDELQELFLDTDANDHNQRFIFKDAVVSNRKDNFVGSKDEKDKIHFDSPLFFDIEEVLKYAQAKNTEIIETGETYASGAKKGQPKTTQGSLYGKLTNFVNRLENKLNDKRLEFLLGKKARKISFQEAISNILGFKKESLSNVTVIDLSGVPFEVLSITVSLISRILFEYGYIYKRLRTSKNPQEKVNNDIPILLVYEEAHKYVPTSDLIKYRASKNSIERIAKEGRKYGVSLLLASQRPSEISETIFSQCNNFIAMRLTNPNDQNYVKRLLPDTLGNLINKLPTLRAGEGLLIGESIVLPSIIQMEKCKLPPSSNDIPYWELWKEEWKDLDFDALKEEWYK